MISSARIALHSHVVLRQHLQYSTACVRSLAAPTLRCTRFTRNSSRQHRDFNVAASLAQTGNRSNMGKGAISSSAYVQVGQITFLQYWHALNEQSMCIYGKVVVALQILGVGLDVADTTPSVLLFFDHHRYVAGMSEPGLARLPTCADTGCKTVACIQRYLFNAGEGFQRFCVQHKLKLNRMTEVLATRASLDAMGGIPGMQAALARIVVLVHIQSTQLKSVPRARYTLCSALRIHILSAGMVLTMSDANNFQNVNSGLGTVSSCTASIYGPKV